MHGAIWRFDGDPDALLAGYDAMVAEIPAGQIEFQLCLRADDGIIVVDTCPSREEFESFRSSPEVRAMLERNGLPHPTIVDHPVHSVVAAGQALV